MSETFRPSTLGEILDRTAQIYRRNFWLFAGVAALPIGTVFAITAIGGALFGTAAVAFRTTSLASPAAIALVVLVVLIAAPVYIAAAVFSSAGLTEAAASTYRGEKITIRGAFASVRPRFWRYLWFIILQGIVVALIPAAIAGAVIGVLIFLGTIAGAGTAGSVAVGFLAVMVVIAAVVVIFLLVLGYSISLPVCVLEKKVGVGVAPARMEFEQGHARAHLRHVSAGHGAGHGRVDDLRNSIYDHHPHFRGRRISAGHWIDCIYRG